MLTAFPASTSHMNLPSPGTTATAVRPFTPARRILPACALVAAFCAASLAGQVARASELTIQDRHADVGILLNQEADYALKNVYVSGLKDAAALTLAGKITSVNLQNCHFGEVTAGLQNHAAGMEATGAVVGSFSATDSSFYDAENQLVSFRDCSFGTVSFQHCTFKTSDQFLKRMYEQNPWRITPPVTEFYNIGRLELLDNQYSNTIIVIHSSVKVVVFRGDISNIQVESPSTQVINLNPETPQPHAGLTPADDETGVVSTSSSAPAQPAATDASSATSSRPIAADSGTPWSPATFSATLMNRPSSPAVTTEAIAVLARK
jgi:hypothetical protein